jgi:1,4-dihydroxy-2-naphthoate octaprenyltransferase
LFVLVLLCLVLVQSGTNLIDEYADHMHGGSAIKIQAPYKVIALGPLAPRCLLGRPELFWHRHPDWYLPGVAYRLASGLVCLASLAVAYGYSAGPWPLGNFGLGEPLVCVFMGPVMVLSSFYVQVQTVNWVAVWLSVPVGCLVTAILVVNDLRDREEDQQSGKVTLVTLWGRQPVIWLYDVLLLVAFGRMELLVVSGVGSWMWLAPLLACRVA